MRGTRRVAVIAAASAAGLAIAASLRPLWLIPAPPSQLPGFARAHGYSAHAPLVMIAMCIAGALLGAVAARYFSGAVTMPRTRAQRVDEVATLAAFIPIYLGVLELFIGLSVA